MGEFAQMAGVVHFGGSESIMPVLTALVISIAVVLTGIAAARIVRAWLKYRGHRVVACPENQKPAGVLVDARHAAATAFGKAPELRLSSCSRWPERDDCGQTCLAQVEASPEDCLVRNILTRWYEGKACASCRRPIGAIDWAGAKPALLRADQISVEWGQIPAEQVQEALETAAPICFACHMANRLVHEHPELALDRGRPPAV
jgi:hypothetical protein